MVVADDAVGDTNDGVPVLGVVLVGCKDERLDGVEPAGASRERSKRVACMRERMPVHDMKLAIICIMVRMKVT